MGLRKAVDLSISYPDATTAALDLAGYNGLAVKVGANSTASATAVLFLSGCDTSAGTFTRISSGDSTVGLKFGHINTLNDMDCYPRYVKVSSDSTTTAAAGLGVTAYVNIVNP